MAKNRQTRFVYLMPITVPLYDLRWLGYGVAGKQLWKIGISSDPDQRRAKVDKSHDYVVKLKYRYYCRNASKHESYLHKLFAEYHHPIEGMDGGTEVYLLRPGHISKARRYLSRNSVPFSSLGNGDALLPTLIFITIGALVLFYLHYVQ